MHCSPGPNRNGRRSQTRLQRLLGRFRAISWVWGGLLAVATIGGGVLAIPTLFTKLSVVPANSVDVSENLKSVPGFEIKNDGAFAINNVKISCGHTVNFSGLKSGSFAAMGHSGYPNRLVKEINADQVVTGVCNVPMDVITFALKHLANETGSPDVCITIIVEYEPILFPFHFKQTFQFASTGSLTVWRPKPSYGELWCTDD
jgi:hypothetical protein